MEEAFKDCNWDKQGLLPCSDVMEEVEEGGKRKREEEVRSPIPRARGHSNACRWDAKDSREQIASGGLEAQYQ